MVDNQGGLDATRVWVGGATGTFAPCATMFRAASTANKRAQFYGHDFTSASLNGTYVLFPCGPILPSRRTSPPIGWYSFYRPTEGRRLSRPRWLVTYKAEFLVCWIGIVALAACCQDECSPLSPSPGSDATDWLHCYWLWTTYRSEIERDCYGTSGKIMLCHAAGLADVYIAQMSKCVSRKTFLVYSKVRCMSNHR